MNISKAVHRLIGQVDELHFYFRGKFSEVKMLCEGCEFNCRKAVNFYQQAGPEYRYR